MSTTLAKVAALRPVTLDGGSPGRLMVIKGEPRGVSWSARVQPEVEAFSLPRGRRVISVRCAGSD